jgi:hypothetical protein
MKQSPARREMGTLVDRVLVVEQWTLYEHPILVRALEKKIDALEEKRKILIDRLKTREETIGDRDGSIDTIQGRVKVLERKVERKELAIAILANVIKLSSLPFEDEGWEMVVS